MARGKVTVLGGTGFLGRRVVRRLLERDFSVRVAARHPERVAALFPDVQLDAIHADVNDDRSVAAAVAGIAGVVNAVSLYRESGPQTFHPFTSKPQLGSLGLREKRASAGSSTCLALARMLNPPRRTSAAAGKEKKLFARLFPPRRLSAPPSCSGEATPSSSRYRECCVVSQSFPYSDAARRSYNPPMSRTLLTRSPG